MRIFTTALLLTAASMTAVAQCDGNRYFNQIFTEFIETENITYGENINSDGENESLELDVYVPVGDTETERPLVIMVHGGSFIAGSKDGADVVSLAEDLVKMGYVVASINYRLGIPIGLDISTLAQNAVVRGFHDGKAAVRWFRQDIAENGNQYGIDGDRIYMVGVSAGGFVALHNAYMDDESEIPSAIDQSLPGLGGGVEGESGNPGYSSEIHGVVNIAGAIKDTTYMEAGDPAVLNFHGTGDTVVPFDADMLQFFGTVDVTEVDGSNAVAIKADELGLVNCFEIYEGQGHVPHVDNLAYYDTTRSITANFLGHLACPEYDLDCEYREIVLNVADADPLVMRAYPNPANDQVMIETPQQEDAVLRITDMRGALILQRELKSAPLHRVNVNQWPAGVYLFHLESSRGTVARRITVQ